MTWDKQVVDLDPSVGSCRYCGQPCRLACVHCVRGRADRLEFDGIDRFGEAVREIRTEVGPLVLVALRAVWRRRL